MKSNIIGQFRIPGKKSMISLFFTNLLVAYFNHAEISSHVGLETCVFYSDCYLIARFGSHKSLHETTLILTGVAVKKVWMHTILAGSNSFIVQPYLNTFSLTVP